jgi:hypothetical protein
MTGSQVWRITPGEAGPRGGAPRPSQPIELRLTTEQTLERSIITAEADIGGARVFARTWETDLTQCEWRIRE